LLNAEGMAKDVQPRPAENTLSRAAFCPVYG
jgi:hypothetical protein